MGIFGRFFSRDTPSADRVDPTASTGDELLEFARGNRTLSGVNVTEQTAMQVGAVYACVQLLAGTMATLPLTFYQREDELPKRIGHAYWWLFNESATNEYTAVSLWEFMMESRLLHGDAFAILHRDRKGAIEGVQPVHPLRTEVQRTRDGWRMYTFWLPDGSVAVKHEDDVLHVAGLGFDGLRSKSPIQHFAAKSSVGLALAQDEIAQRTMGNGNHSDLLLTTAAKMNDDQKSSIRRELEERYGGLSNSGRPMVLSGEYKLEKLSMSPVDIQLLEARQFSVVDIARIYGVAPHMIGSTDKATSWGSGIEAMSLGFMKFTFKRHTLAFKQEINRKLFPRDSKVYCEHDLDSLLEGDSKTQGEYYSRALGGPGQQGWMTPDEVRARKNMPPIPGGNRLIISGANNANA